ncbi:MAG: transferase hexapeptide repeat containing protein, partial [Verrucomicrobiaceae bacterium]|nr:transferase hexapeptide repeat containing protein [Verrucomicrobiaceae bacterium]
IHRRHPGVPTLADRVYYLNKALNGMDLFYEVEMPAIFSLDHPVGSVLGRAVYGDYFSFSQGCTVGNNRGVYPTLGTNVRMLSDSKVIGKCTIGDNVILSAGCYVKDTDVPSCSLVFGTSPNLTIVRKEVGYFL